jgi:hypothetical protein
MFCNTVIGSDTEKDVHDIQVCAQELSWIFSDTS